MSVQSTLTGFYSVRKRNLVEDVKKHSKVRIIDESVESLSRQDTTNDTVLLLSQSKEIAGSKVNSSGNTILKTAPRVNNSILRDLSSSKSARKTGGVQDWHKGKRSFSSNESKSQTSLSHLFFSAVEKDVTPETVLSIEKDSQPSVHTTQQADSGNKHEELFPVVNEILPVKEDATGESQQSFLSTPKKKHVVFEKIGKLSPRKVDDIRVKENVMSKESAASAAGRHVGSQEKNSHETPAVSGKADRMSRKELSLADIRGRVLGNRRLAELKESIARVSSCAAKIREADRQVSSGVMPSLRKFQEIEFEVPVLKSPSKAMPGSPIKTPPSSPVAAYQRFTQLTASRAAFSPSKTLPASPSKGTSLCLPYQYRCLAEVFRCVDVVVSMMINRKEKITFNKLRPAAQEMLRKNVSERHLGQIKKVFPDAFDYKYEKVNQLTISSAKAERYDLVIAPLFKPVDDVQKEGSKTMTPSVLLERRHQFHKCLLELVKDHHEEFLQSLDPPMTVPRDKLTRWHPAFEVDILPEVDPAEIPQPPNAPDKCSSAKDVLDKARDLFGCNARMERALEKVSVSESKGQNSVTVTPSNNSSTSADVPFLNPALRGIPPALLKKVRERQAAKALMAMTMSPAEEKHAERLSRLPELARVLRGIYVSERRGVLSLDIVLQKLLDSYKASLNSVELDEHLKLLEGSVQGWISRCTIRNAQYIKLSRDADISRVISKLERLAHGSKQ
ncbi:DNA replication factor Cdt1 [Hetaerina americana]|uniref:DNA replication factor Cdt1 n=1 Tax=Hetaerina americana TaxID=62018 RepID=UPI003A7F11BD